MGAGRPSSYRSDFAEQAEKLCRLGATDENLADFFGVCAKTIANWKDAEPEFLQALKSGKAPADTEVTDALFQRARGFRWTEQQAVKYRPGKGGEDVKVIEVERVVPPDTTACIFWLKNRRPDLWRDTQRQELTGANGGPIEHTISDREAAREMLDRAFGAAGDGGGGAADA
jgi:hypothetical protein